EKGNSFAKSVIASIILAALQSMSYASAGTEGASFLDIPVGAGPAGLGGAYSALARDAYAPTWNPAGLGSVEANEAAAQHLSYLESMNYEYLSFVHPMGDSRGTSAVHRGVGFSAQYLGSGDITRADVDQSGNPIISGATYSSHYGAYSVA